MDTDEEPLVVSMNGTGELFINVGGNGETPVTLGVVKDRVMKVLAAKPGTPVQLRGDEGLDYGRVMEVMAALQGVGVTSIGLVAENTMMDRQGRESDSSPDACHRSAYHSVIYFFIAVSPEAKTITPPPVVVFRQPN